MKPIIIYGSGGFAREIAWLIERINNNNPTWNILGYIDDNTANHGNVINSYSVLGNQNILTNYEEVSVVLAIGKSTIREKIASNILDYKKLEFPNLIDPSVIYSEYIDMGIGNIICANTVLTTNIKLGNFNIINLNCTLGHDVDMEDYVTILPSSNISGNCTIKKCAELGTKTTVIPQKIIGEYSIVGAGSVVIRDIPNYCIAVGVPARPIK